LGAAAKISELALARPRGLPAPDTILVPTDRVQGDRVNDDQPVGSRGGLTTRYFFATDGEYLFEMRPKWDDMTTGYRGVTAEPQQLAVRIDGVKAWTGIVGGPEFSQ